MKRLALYVFWEKQGIVREHNFFYLNGLKEIAQHIVLIANGMIDDKGRLELEEQGFRVLQRENVGLDFSAWKVGLDHFGWDTVLQYDELILCNCSCYGPMYPFAEMFDTMQERPCDFWGINRQPDAPNHFVGPKTRRFPMTEHIQSYFYVFRSKALHSPAFRQWWDELVPSRDYWDEVRNHEMRFSPWLEEHGLVGTTFMDFEKYLIFAPQGNANFICADSQLIEDRNPLVKRKLVFSNNKTSITVLNAIQMHTEYPIPLILDDLKRQMSSSLFQWLKAELMARFAVGTRKSHYEVKSEKYRLLRLLKHSSLFKKK